MFAIDLKGECHAELVEVWRAGLYGDVLYVESTQKRDMF